MSVGCRRGEGFVSRSEELGERGGIDAVVVLAEEDVTIYVGQEPDQEKRLEKVERVLKQFDWSKKLCFSGLEDEFIEVLETIVGQNCEVNVESCYAYRCPTEKMTNSKRFLLTMAVSKCNTELVVDKIEEHEVGTVNHLWAYADSSSLKYLRNSVKVGPSCCLRTHSGTRESTESSMVGWLGTHNDMSFGFLYVLDSFRRLGIASLLIESLAQKTKKLLDKWITNNDSFTQKSQEMYFTYAFIAKKNLRSQQVFEACGFSKFLGSSWVFTTPTSSPSS